MAAKYVYFFGDGKAEGNAEMKNLLGGKGANLAEMTSIGLPVPPGFTISTEVCTEFYKNNENYPAGLTQEVEANLKKVEELMGKRFGDPKNPLLVSVRSGARASMPGMMDTILNLGLNDVTVQGVIEQSRDERFAYDAYRRFVQMYSDVVMGMSKDMLEHLLEHKKEEKGAHLDTELNERSGNWAVFNSELACSACGAKLSIPSDQNTTTCPFCDSDQVVIQPASPDLIPPTAIIPFQLHADDVDEILKKARLSRGPEPGSLTQIYLPFWTFDAATHSAWTADAGFDYQVEVQVEENGQVRTRHETRTRWEPAEGVLEHFFDDELRRLVGECYRVLKPGAGIRLIVPNLSSAISAYADKRHTWFYDGFPHHFDSLGGRFSIDRRLATTGASRGPTSERGIQRHHNCKPCAGGAGTGSSSRRTSCGRHLRTAGLKRAKRCPQNSSGQAEACPPSSRSTLITRSLHELGGRPAYWSIYRSISWSPIAAISSGCKFWRWAMASNAVPLLTPSAVMSMYWMPE